MLSLRKWRLRNIKILWAQLVPEEIVRIFRYNKQTTVMKTKQQSNYGGIEEDFSLKAFAVFFIIGVAIALVPLLVLTNL